MALVELVIFTQACRDNFLQIKSHPVMFCDLRLKRKLRLPVAAERKPQGQFYPAAFEFLTKQSLLRRS